MVRGGGAGRVAIIYGQVRRYKENGGAKEEKKRGEGEGWNRSVVNRGGDVSNTCYVYSAV